MRIAACNGSHVKRLMFNANVYVVCVRKRQEKAAEKLMRHKSCVNDLFEAQ